MPRRARTSIALPWERQGSRLRELVATGQWRRVALALVALGIAGGIWQSAEARGKVRRTREEIAETRRALAQFREHMGRCPYSIGELVHPSRAGVRYLRDEPLDGWGNPLWVRCPGRYDEGGVDVVSAGPSGNFLVDDNIQ
jgi:hypothetical protein